MKYTLPRDSEARKEIRLLAAFLNYIPAAAVKFAQHSLANNEKHNPGEPVHHARGKSGDHEECLLRHLMDLQDIKAAMERSPVVDPELVKLLISEATAEFWRSGVFLQELCEKYEGAPLAPGARLPVNEAVEVSRGSFVAPGQVQNLPRPPVDRSKLPPVCPLGTERDTYPAVWQTDTGWYFNPDRANQDIGACTELHPSEAAARAAYWRWKDSQEGR